MSLIDHGCSCSLGGARANYSNNTTGVQCSLSEQCGPGLFCMIESGSAYGPAVGRCAEFIPAGTSAEGGGCYADKECVGDLVCDRSHVSAFFEKGVCIFDTTNVSSKSVNSGGYQIREGKLGSPCENSAECTGDLRCYQYICQTNSMMENGVQQEQKAISDSINCIEEHFPNIRVRKVFWKDMVITWKSYGKRNSCLMSSEKKIIGEYHVSEQPEVRECTKPLIVFTPNGGWGEAEPSKCFTKKARIPAHDEPIEETTTTEILLRWGSVNSKLPNTEIENAFQETPFMYVLKITRTRMPPFLSVAELEGNESLRSVSPILKPLLEEKESRAVGLERILRSINEETTNVLGWKNTEKEGILLLETSAGEIGGGICGGYLGVKLVVQAETLVEEPVFFLNAIPK